MPPVNDNFVNAIDLGSASNGAMSGTNVGATAETMLIGGVVTPEWPLWAFAPVPLNQTGGRVAAQATVWWKWTCPTTGDYWFSTYYVNAGGFKTNFNSAMDAWYGHGANPETLSDMSEFAYLYNQAAGIGNMTYGGIIAFHVAQGTEVWIRVGTRDGSTGNIYLEWDQWTGAPRLGSCTGCALDFQAETCLGTLQLSDGNSQVVQSFGTFPQLAGFYNVTFCAGDTSLAAHNGTGCLFIDEPLFTYVQNSMPIQPWPGDGTSNPAHSVWRYGGSNLLFYYTQDSVADWMPTGQTTSNSCWLYLGTFDPNFVQPQPNPYSDTQNYLIGDKVILGGFNNWYQATVPVPAHQPGSAVLPAVPYRLTAGLCNGTGFFCGTGGNIGFWRWPDPNFPDQGANNPSFQLVFNQATPQMFSPYQVGIAGSGTSWNTGFVIQNISLINWAGSFYYPGGSGAGKSSIIAALLNTGGISGATGGNQGNGTDIEDYAPYPAITSTGNFQFTADFAAGLVTATFQLSLCGVVIGTISFPFYPIITVLPPTLIPPPSGGGQTWCGSQYQAVSIPISTYIISNSYQGFYGNRGLKITVSPNSFMVWQPTPYTYPPCPGGTTLKTFGIDNGSVVIGLQKGSGAVTLTVTPYCTVNGTEHDEPPVQFVVTV